MIDAAFGTMLAAPPLRVAASSRREHAWAVLATVLDPEVPVVSVVDLGIVRDVVEERRRARRRRHADLFRLPGDRGDRAEHRRRARRRGPRPGARRACSARPPGPPTGSAPRASDKLRGYGIAPPGPADAARGVAMRFVPRPVAPARLPALREHATPSASPPSAPPPARRSGAAAACGEPFEHFKPI